MNNYISGLLNDFINDKSDNSPMEAADQERFENDFKSYLESQPVDQDVVDLLIKMAEKSLPQNIHNYFIVAIWHLCNNRRNLIVSTELEAEFRKSYETIGQEGLKALKIIWSDKENEPMAEDALMIAGIN